MIQSTVSITQPAITVQKLSGLGFIDHHLLLLR